MSEKKVVIALGIICIILLVGTVGAVIYYNNVVNDKNATYNSYVSSHIHANSEFDSLKSDYSSYKTSHSYTDSEYNSLQSTYDSYIATHSHTDSDYNSVASQLASANTQIGNLARALNENPTTELIFQQQPDAVISQANPVSGTLYTVLEATNARIISIVGEIVWEVTQPTLLEVVLTIDGQEITHIATDPISAQGYSAAISEGNPPTAQALGLITTVFTAYRAFLYEGRNVKVQIRVTWEVTQPTPLICRVKWAQL